MPGDDASRAETTGAETVVWNVRLLKNRPVQGYVILAAAMGACVLGWFGFGHPLLGVLGFVMILGSTAEYWMGTRYSVKPDGASARVGPSLTSIEWANVKRVLVDGYRIKLSPLSQESAAEVFRGVTLLTTSDNRETVLAIVRDRCGENVRFLGI